jgi:hypothetical protein
VLLVASIKGREFDGISDEEDREVVADDIIVPFFGVEFHRPTSYVADCIGGPFFETDSRYAHQYFGLLTDLAKEGGGGNVGDVVGYFEFAPCSCGFGMDGPLRDTLPREVSEDFD